ncbi:MAG TPA: hypothetical protein VFZ43_00955 [Anaerolineales bacterium]
MTSVNGQTLTNAKIHLYNVGAASEGGDPSTQLRAGYYHVSDDAWPDSIGGTQRSEFMTDNMYTWIQRLLE